MKILVDNMFNQAIWRSQIDERFQLLGRHPWQEVQISGTYSVLTYLAIRTLEPFWEAFEQHPIAAVLALAEITTGPGADHLVRRSAKLRYQAAQILAQDLRAIPELRLTLEDLMVKLETLQMARRRLNSSRDEWFRSSLLAELAHFEGPEFARMREALRDPVWKSIYDIIRGLRKQRGNYTPADLAILDKGLKSSASNVRSEASRKLGDFVATPPAAMTKTLVQMALYDCELETRNAASRALGTLWNRVSSPKLLDYLAGQLASKDNFVRSAAAHLLSQLGEFAGTEELIVNLLALLKDEEAYTREAAARALGRMGTAAITPEVLNMLTQTVQDGDPNVHEAALDSLLQLRKLRATILLHLPTIVNEEEAAEHEEQALKEALFLSEVHHNEIDLGELKKF
jgi:hypothetical protein